MPPPASEPTAVATEPTRLYQAKTCVRRSPGTACDRAACSMARKGPTSYPLGLMTPIVAAARRTTNRSVPMKTRPAPSSSSDPSGQHRRRPIPVGVGAHPERDGGIADQRERQEQADPPLVQAQRRQIQRQDDRQEPIAEHPHDPGRKQDPAIRRQVRHDRPLRIIPAPASAHRRCPPSRCHGIP